MSTKFRIPLAVILLLCLVLTSLSLPSQGRTAASTEGAEFTPGHLLVRFQGLTSEALKEAARVDIGAKLQRRYDLVSDLELLTLPAGLSVAEAVDRVSRLPQVFYAQPDYIYHTTVIPNDPRWGDLWGMTNIKAPTAWDTFTGNASLVVADIDTGIDYNHPDLAANVWTNPGEIAGNGIDDDLNGYIDDIHGWDFAYDDNDPFDGNGHGSHTAGTIGATGNNGVGVVGVNWNVKIMALKFLNDSGSGTTADAISSVQYATMMKVKISNNSWGGGSYDQALYDAINAAKSVGHLFIAAAGNSGINTDRRPHYPSSYNLDNIISVAAIDSSDAKASFSNYGATTVDLGAPGVSILSTTPGNNYEYYSGTSMAAPHVSGVAALLYGMHPDWTYQSVRDAILKNVRSVSSMQGKTVTGGVLDAAAALGAGSPPPPAQSMHLGNLTGSSSNVNNRTWQAKATITVHDANHNPVANATVSGGWSSGTSGTCTTASNGTCAMTTNLNKSRFSSVTFTVNNITHATLVYDASKNEVGTSITINRP